MRPSPPRTQISECDEERASDRIVEQASYVPTLDGWRALAIVGVMVSHSNQLVEAGGLFHSEAAEAVFRNLRLGVDLFFAVSGFLITRLLLEECTRAGTISLKGFIFGELFESFR
jgi:peptidoglycan/LPS O-acetylase OafA/YrhL